MRSLLFILAAFFFQNTVHAQNELSESERNLIKSQAIRVKEQWDFKYSGNKLASRGFVSSRTIFDKEGRIIEVINYKDDTAVMNVSTYVYNENGQRSDYVKYRGNKNEILYKRTTKYNAANKKILEIGFNGADDFRNQFNYDTKGKLVEIRYFTAKKLDEVRSMTYKGNQSEMKVMDESGNILSYVITKRDEKDRITEESSLDKNKKMIEKMLYTYDSLGNLLVEEKQSNGKKIVRNEYMYDKSSKLQEVYSDEGDVPRYLKQNFSFGTNGTLLGEFWKNAPNAEQSFRKYNYDSSGRLLTTDCYFASYKYKVLNKFMYQTY